VLNVVGGLFSDYVLSAEVGSVINLKPGGGIYGAVVHGVMNMEPGSLGMGSGTIDGGTLNVSGGVSGIPSLSGNGIVNFNGGKIASLSSSGGEINFYSGELGSSFWQNTTINIHSAVGSGFGPTGFTAANSTMNYRGGALTADQGPALNFHGLLHLFVQNATVNGQPIPGLAPGQTATIAARDVTLDGTLQDGSPLNLYAAGSNFNAKFYIPPETTLQVTQVPEPAGAILCVVGLAAVRTCGGRFRTASWAVR
jgi:hypothetical protein